jgi:hypothetical protein
VYKDFENGSSGDFPTSHKLDNPEFSETRPDNLDTDTEIVTLDGDSPDPTTGAKTKKVRSSMHPQVTQPTTQKKKAKTTRSLRKLSPSPEPLQPIFFNGKRIDWENDPHFNKVTKGVTSAARIAIAYLTLQRLKLEKQCTERSISKQRYQQRLEQLEDGFRYAENQENLERFRQSLKHHKKAKSKLPTMMNVGRHIERCIARDHAERKGNLYILPHSEFEVGIKLGWLRPSRKELGENYFQLSYPDEESYSDGAQKLKEKTKIEVNKRKRGRKGKKNIKDSDEEGVSDWEEEGHEAGDVIVVKQPVAPIKRLKTLRRR